MGQTLHHYVEIIQACHSVRYHKCKRHNRAVIRMMPLIFYTLAAAREAQNLSFCQRISSGNWFCNSCIGLALVWKCYIHHFSMMKITWQWCLLNTMAWQITQQFVQQGARGWHQNKYQSSASLALCEDNSLVTGGFPSQRASNVEWHHHAYVMSFQLMLQLFISTTFCFQCLLKPKLNVFVGLLSTSSCNIQCRTHGYCMVIAIMVVITCANADLLSIGTLKRNTFQGNIDKNVKTLGHGGN